MKKYLPFALSTLVMILVPLSSVDAQAGGFVPCDGPTCSACDLVSMINRIIIWLFGFVFVVFAVLMVVAGFGLVTSGGNQSALDAAKSKFQNALIGIIIMMAAWLIVDTLLRAILAGGTGQILNYGPWSEVQCFVQTVPSEAPAAPTTPTTPTTPPPTTAQCQDDAALMTQYGGSPVGVEAPGLQNLISCYLADPAVSAITDRGQLYTVDRSHPRCSLTNGNTVCGPCSHSANSAHYGRGSGQGARAVDFNASGGSESALYNAIRARQSACGGTLLFEGDHTHITM